MRGEIAAGAVAALQRDLPGLTHGEGMCQTEHDRFEPVREAVGRDWPRTTMRLLPG